MEAPDVSKVEQPASCSGRADGSPQAGASALGNLPRRSLDSGASSPPANRVSMHGPFAAPPGALRDTVSMQQPVTVHSPDITCHLRPIVSAPQPHTPTGVKGVPTQKNKLECLIMSPTRKTAAKTGKWNYSVSVDGSAAALVGVSAVPHTPMASDACGGTAKVSADGVGLGGAAANGKGLRLPVLPPMSSAEFSPTSATVGALSALNMAGTPVGLSAGLMDARSPQS